MILRKIKRQDIPHASKIVELNYSKKWKRHVTNEIRETFGNCVLKPEYVVAEDKGKIIGFAGYSQSWINYHIYNIFWVNVDIKYQRRGVGKLLIKNILKRLKSKTGENKANMILLTAKSPEYYKKFGFKILNEFKEKDYLMALNL